MRRIRVERRKRSFLGTIILILLIAIGLIYLYFLITRNG